MKNLNVIQCDNVDEFLGYIPECNRKEAVSFFNSIEGTHSNYFIYDKTPIFLKQFNIQEAIARDGTGQIDTMFSVYWLYNAENNFVIVKTGSFKQVSKSGELIEKEAREGLNTLVKSTAESINEALKEKERQVFLEFLKLWSCFVK